jgi:hypothetical protein
MDTSDATPSFSLLNYMPRLLCGFATSITINPNKPLQIQENVLNYYCNKKGV